MASSIYLYHSMKDYETYYKGKTDQLLFHMPIIDMYIDPENKQLFVITNQDNNAKKQIDFHRSIVHVRNESWRPDILMYSGTVETVQHDKMVYNGNTGYIDFFPRFLRKPKYSQRIDRVVGGITKYKKWYIDYDKKFYDFTQNRINLIMNGAKASLYERLRQ